MDKNIENHEEDIKVVKKLEEKVMTSPFHVTVSSDPAESPTNDAGSSNSDASNSTNGESGKANE